jgi:retron-type reverse transcriptase
MNILERNIQDTTILRLIRTGLKAKVFQEDKSFYKPEVGTTLLYGGGILSPLLSNIYLNELDQYMSKLCEQYQSDVKPSNRKKNPAANKLLRYGKKSEYININCKYIRYADDFIIGTLGPRSMAIEIRDKVKDFLKTELNVALSLEKSQISHITKGIEFLGYLFSIKQLFVKQSYGGSIVKRKMTIPILNINMKKVIA